MRSRGLVIQADGHERRLSHHAKVLGQAPAEQLAVTGRHKEPWPEEGWCRPDQGLQVIIRLAPGLMEPPNPRRVARNPVQALDDVSGSAASGIGELARSIVSVNTETELTTSRDISLPGWANLISRKCEVKRHEDRRVRGRRRTDVLGSELSRPVPPFGKPQRSDSQVAKPGDLPTEEPKKFEMVMNLKTAKALGLTIPPSLRGRADEAIQ
jgi:hypothetical protein